MQVLDARRNDERAAGYVAGSQHIPLHELPDRLDEVPQGEVWVYCGSGYRASIAASILDRPGRQIVLINDDYDNAVAAGLQDERPTDRRRRRGRRPLTGPTGLTGLTGGTTRLKEIL